MQRPLHIGISARAMSLPYGGVKEYVTSTIHELVKLDSPHRFSVYYAEQHLIGRYPEAHEIHLAAPHKFVWDHWVLPQQMRRDQIDIAWFPHNVSSLGLSVPTVVSVMDLLYFPVPEFSGREYAWPDTLYMRHFIPRSVQQARKVMAISNWTAFDLQRLLGVEQSKIHTIYLAQGKEFAPASPAEQQRIRQLYSLEQPFFFYSGTLSPRKNVRILVEAFGRIAQTIPHDLVVTGGPGYIETAFDDLAERYGIVSRVRRLGLVPKQDLVALYSASEASLYPSKYEGFGIPILEAFACGCPVICSNTTSLGEVAGEAALTCSPDDVDGFAAHMHRISQDDNLREQLRKAGFERLKEFSYARAAQTLLNVIERAAA